MAWQPSYVDTTDLATYVGDSSGALPAAQLTWAISAASRVVDEFTGRQFGVLTEAEERFYTARYDYERDVYVVDIDDVMTTDDLVVKVDGAATNDYTLEPRNAVSKGFPWTRVALGSSHSRLSDLEVSVTAKWGWAATPDTVEQAVLLQASRLIARRDAPFGISGSPDVGAGEVRLLARVDPDVAVMLAHYRRLGAVA